MIKLTELQDLPDPYQPIKEAFQAGWFAGLCVGFLAGLVTMAVIVILLRG